MGELFTRGSILEYLLEVRSRRGAGYLTLLDPDRLEPEELEERAALCAEVGADAILVGTSLTMLVDHTALYERIKRQVEIPVITFPGSGSHVSPLADAILFLSMVSSRNPELLIGEQVRTAPLLKKCGVEIISTGYMLIESGVLTSVHAFATDPKRGIFILAFLAVVIGGLVVYSRQIKEFGLWAIGAVLIGISMLVIYVAKHFEKKGKQSEKASQISDYAVAALILGAIIVLVVSLIWSFVQRSGLFPKLILGLFLWVFIGIFRDYIKHLKSKAKEKNGTPPGNT